MTGLTRPELLVSTSWLAENISRLEIRILDVRWRPDGSGQATFNAGHIPAAAYLDWRAELIEADEDEEVFLLAGPDRVSGALGRAGIGDGMTAVVYDDTQNLFASRVWWSMRAYGFESARLLDGGFPAWVGENRTVSNAQQAPSNVNFTPRAQLSARLTTADIRRLLGVTGRPDPRCTGAGRVPWPRGEREAAGPHSRSGQRAGRCDEPAGFGTCARPMSSARSSTAPT